MKSLKKEQTDQMMKEQCYDCNKTIHIPKGTIKICKECNNIRKKESKKMKKENNEDLREYKKKIIETMDDEKHTAYDINKRPYERTNQYLRFTAYYQDIKTEEEFEKITESNTKEIEKTKLVYTKVKKKDWKKTPINERITISERKMKYLEREDPKEAKKYKAIWTKKIDDPRVGKEREVKY